MTDDELRSLFESVVLFANDVVLVTEAEPVDAPSGGPRVVYVNPAFSRMTGYRSEDIVGLTPRVLQSPKTDQSQLDLVRRALAAWRPVEVELLNMRKDGTEFWVQLSITPVRDPSGRFTHWIAIQRDVTARKTRELAIQVMLEQSTDLMLITDPSGRILEVNASARARLGHSPAELVGRSFMSLVHPDDAGSSASLLAVDKAVRVGDDAMGTWRFRHGNGNWRWMDVFASDLDPERSAVVLVCTDITARVEAEIQAERASRVFRSTFDDAPIGMALTDADGRLTQVNTALCTLLGRDRAELQGAYMAQFVHSDDAGIGDDQRRALLDGRFQRIRHETRFLHADGSVVGVLHSSSVVEGDDGTPSYLVDHIEDITDRQQFEDQLRYQALHDTLTGLANRALFVDRLELVLQGTPAPDRHTAVLFLDLDRFKTVNDTHGHGIGDRVLIEIARRITTLTAGPGTSAARLSGDEFVLLLTDVTAEQAVSAAHRLRALFDEVVSVDSVDIRVSASIGVALSGQRSDSQNLLRQADAAMYTAKDRGRNRIEIFEKGVGDRIVAISMLQSELRVGIPRDELRLYYQPEISLLHGAVTGVEALVRWQHPTRGLLPPRDFIGIAEDSGQIHPLGSWVLDEALRTVVKQRTEGPGAPTTWVNLSPHQLHTVGFADQIRAKLAAQGLPGHVLGFEITENILMSDVMATRDTLAALRDLGIKIAIDDFGTGYSSLSYLAEFPVDVVKIDRSFVVGLDQDGTRRESFAIVGAIIGLAHALNLDVVAEGVETANQADALHGLGCDSGQGFFYAHPAP